MVKFKDIKIGIKIYLVVAVLTFITGFVGVMAIPGKRNSFRLP